MNIALFGVYAGIIFGWYLRDPGPLKATVGHWALGGSEPLELCFWVQADGTEFLNLLDMPGDPDDWRVFGCRVHWVEWPRLGGKGGS